jgi:hypothetical protein
MNIKNSDTKLQVPGVLSVVHMTQEEREFFIDYLDKTKPGLKTDYLFSVFGDNELLKFFDVFSGASIKVPPREEIKKLVNYIKIYAYCKSRGLTEESFERASKIFGRRTISIERVVMKVERILKDEKREGNVDE